MRNHGAGGIAPEQGEDVVRWSKLKRGDGGGLWVAKLDSMMKLEVAEYEPESNGARFAACIIRADDGMYISRSGRNIGMGNVVQHKTLAEAKRVCEAYTRAMLLRDLKRLG